MSYILKRIKYTIIQLEIVIQYNQVLIVFFNVSARIWSVITTHIDVNISFMQIKIV